MAKKKMLVVDDEVHVVELLKAVFEEEFDVVKAFNGEEALRQVAAEKPDIVLLDVNMPDMNGYDVCKRVKSNPETRSTLILMISAFAQKDNVDYGMNLGAAGYITKPFKIAQVQQTVRQLLKP